MRSVANVHLAYWVVGTDAIDMVLALGFVSHLDVFWDYPSFLRLVDRLASFSCQTEGASYAVS